MTDDQSKDYQRIFEVAGEGVWELDARGRTVAVNRRLTRMLGYSQAWMLGRALFEFMDKDGRALAVGKVGRRRPATPIERHEFKFRRKCGADLWALVATALRTDDDGRYAGAILTVIDVTERRAAGRPAVEGEPATEDLEPVAIAVENPHPPLSPREREVLGLLAIGLNGEKVARRLYLSPETVRTHVRNAMTKLDASTRVQAIALAIQQGEIEP